MPCRSICKMHQLTDTDTTFAATPYAGTHGPYRPFSAGRDVALQSFKADIHA